MHTTWALFLKGAGLRIYIVICTVYIPPFFGGEDQSWNRTGQDRTKLDFSQCMILKLILVFQSFLQRKQLLFGFFCVKILCQRLLEIRDEKENI